MSVADKLLPYRGGDSSRLSSRKRGMSDEGHLTKPFPLWYGVLGSDERLAASPLYLKMKGIFGNLKRKIEARKSRTDWG